MVGQEISGQVFSLLQGLTIGITTLGFVLNSLCIYGIYKTRSFRTDADLALNLNLAFSDNILCLVWITTQIYTLTSGKFLSDLPEICRLEGLVLFTFLASSVFTLTAISIFHFCAVVMGKIGSRAVVGFVIALIWISSIIGGLYGFGALKLSSNYIVQPSQLYCLNNFAEQELLNRLFNASIAFILFAVPLFLLVIYFTIWRALRLHLRDLIVRKERSSGINVSKMIIRRAITLSVGFACVFYFDAALFSYQIITGQSVPWLFDAIGACLGPLITVFNPLTFFYMDTKVKNAIFSKKRVDYTVKEIRIQSKYHNQSSERSEFY